MQASDAVEVHRTLFRSEIGNAGRPRNLFGKQYGDAYAMIAGSQAISEQAREGLLNDGGARLFTSYKGQPFATVMTELRGTSRGSFWVRVVSFDEKVDFTFPAPVVRADLKQLLDLWAERCVV